MACVPNVTVSLPSYKFVCGRRNMLYNAVIFLSTLVKGIEETAFVSSKTVMVTFGKPASSQFLMSSVNCKALY